MEMANNSMKLGKAGSSDGITPEFIKFATEELKKVLQTLFQECCLNEKHCQ